MLGKRDYLVFGDERITYAQAHDTVASVAAWLRAQGVLPGDRVAIAMRNYPEWLLAFWACVSTGAAVVALNAWSTAVELKYALDDAAPKVVFADSERLDRLPPRHEDRPAVVAVRAPPIEGILA